MKSFLSLMLTYTLAGIVLSLLARGGMAVTQCPSATPSPSNPVGCLLYNFTSSTSGPFRTQLDSFAQPNTLIITGSAGVAVHHLNGTLYKFLSVPTGYGFGEAAVDSDGVVFLETGSDLLLFSPYPSYLLFSILPSFSSIYDLGVITVAQGEFLFSAAGASLNAFRIDCTALTVIGSAPILVGKTPDTSNYEVFGAAVSPVTGQVALIDSYIGSITLYTPVYNNGSSVSFVQGRSYDTYSSALSQGFRPYSAVITTGGQIIVVYGGIPTSFTILNPDGSSASGPVAVDTGFRGGFHPHHNRNTYWFYDFYPWSDYEHRRRLSGRGVLSFGQHHTQQCKLRLGGQFQYIRASCGFVSEMSFVHSISVQSSGLCALFVSHWAGNSQIAHSRLFCSAQYAHSSSNFGVDTFFLNGSVFKSIYLGSAYQIESVVVDTDGVVYITDANFLYIVTPFPSYSLFSVVQGVSRFEIRGSVIAAKEQFLFFSLGFESLSDPQLLSAYRISCNASRTINFRAAGSISSFNGGVIHPITGQIASLSRDRVLTLYTVTYPANATLNVTFSVDRVYTATNSALSLLLHPMEFTITATGVFVIVDTLALTFVLMLADGSSASGQTAISTGTRYWRSQSLTGVLDSRFPCSDTFGINNFHR